MTYKDLFTVLLRYAVFGAFAYFLLLPETGWATVAAFFSLTVGVDTLMWLTVIHGKRLKIHRELFEEMCSGIRNIAKDDKAEEVELE